MTNDIYDTIKYPDFSLMKKNFLFLQKRKNKMTKSQDKISEQLTEQWKKRTLRNGAYYIKMLGGDILPAFCNTEYILKQFQTMKGIYSDVAEVLAEVPSYEKWQASEKYNKHLEEVIKVYERKDKQATETSIAYGELLEENEKLKELLKEVLQHELSLKEISELTRKISEVLK